MSQNDVEVAARTREQLVEVEPERDRDGRDGRKEDGGAVEPAGLAVAAADVHGLTTSPAGSGLAVAAADVHGLTTSAKIRA